VARGVACPTPSIRECTGVRASSALGEGGGKAREGNRAIGRRDLGVDGAEEDEEEEGGV